jgi:hypothetical protein
MLSSSVQNSEGRDDGDSGDSFADPCQEFKGVFGVSSGRCRFTAGNLKAFFLIFCFDFLHIDPSNNFCFCKFFAKGLKS